MTKKLMTNINESSYAFLAEISSKNNLTKRMVLEQALEHYKIFLKEAALDKAYTRMSKDQEYLNEMRENTNFLWSL